MSNAQYVALLNQQLAQAQLQGVGREQAVAQQQQQQQVRGEAELVRTRCRLRKLREKEPEKYAQLRNQYFESLEAFRVAVGNKKSEGC